jgi:hypothetical protein
MPPSEPAFSWLPCGLTARQGMLIAMSTYVVSLLASNNHHTSLGRQSEWALGRGYQDERRDD